MLSKKRPEVGGFRLALIRNLKRRACTAAPSLTRPGLAKERRRKRSKGRDRRTQAGTGIRPPSRAGPAFPGPPVPPGRLGRASPEPLRLVPVPGHCQWPCTDGLVLSKKRTLLSTIDITFNLETRMLFSPGRESRLLSSLTCE